MNGLERRLEQNLLQNLEWSTKTSPQDFPQMSTKTSHQDSPQMSTKTSPDQHVVAEPPRTLVSPDKPSTAYYPWHGHGASYADAKTVLHAGRQQLSVKQTRRQLPLSVRQPAADEMNARWLGARTASVLEDPRMDPRPSNDKLLPPWLPPELGITDEDEAEAVAQLDARGRRVLAQTRPQSAPTLLDGVPATSHVRMPIGNARWSQTLVSCTDGLRPP